MAVLRGAAARRVGSGLDLGLHVDFSVGGKAHAPDGHECRLLADIGAIESQLTGIINSYDRGRAANSANRLSNTTKCFQSPRHFHAAAKEVFYVLHEWPTPAFAVVIAAPQANRVSGSLLDNAFQHCRSWPESVCSPVRSKADSRAGRGPTG